MNIGAGRLDRRIQFRRGSVVTGGLGAELIWDTANPAADDLGGPVSAMKVDISDGERWRAGEVAAHVTTRFVIRYSPFAAGITPQDRLVMDGRVYDIHGIKEPPGSRRRWIEITASARNDL